jgi:hypothetical protein
VEAGNTQAGSVPIRGMLDPLMVLLVQLTAEEGPRLRAIRLRALLDAPDAFGSTFEETDAQPPESWSKPVAGKPPR